MTGLESECIHRFNSLGLPVRNDIRIIFIQSEVFADVEIEIIFIPFITKQGIRPRQGFHIDEIPETTDLGLLIGEAPGIEIEVEIIMLHHVLLHPVHFLQRPLFIDARKPGIIPPFPDLGRHDVCVNQGI